MKIYIASSWCQAARVNVLAAVLRNAGHTVFDFTQQEGAIPRDALPPFTIQPYRAHLVSLRPLAYDQIVNDVRHVSAADVVVLLLPCGSDAHFELGLAYGLGTHTVVVGQAAPDQFVSMHLLAGAILDRDDEVLDYIAGLRP